MAQLSRLEHEVNALELSARTALKNPFIPAAARDGLAQGLFVLRTLCAEVTQLKQQLALNTATTNGEFRAMRLQIGAQVTQAAELGGR